MSSSQDSSLPSALLESLRSIGYALDTALADIIDNSIRSSSNFSGQLLLRRTANGAVQASWQRSPTASCKADSEDCRRTLAVISGHCATVSRWYPSVCPTYSRRPSDRKSCRESVAAEIAIPNYALSQFFDETASLDGGEMHEYLASQISLFPRKNWQFL